MYQIKITTNFPDLYSASKSNLPETRPPGGRRSLSPGPHRVDNGGRKPVRGKGPFRLREHSAQTEDPVREVLGLADPDGHQETEDAGLAPGAATLQGHRGRGGLDQGEGADRC